MPDKAAIVCFSVGTVKAGRKTQSGKLSGENRFRET